MERIWGLPNQRKAPNAYIPARRRFLQYGRRVMEVEHDTIRQTANRRPISIGRIIVHGPHPHADGLGRAHADEQILEYGADPRIPGSKGSMRAEIEPAA